ncbi:uncharacterized [Tachysurus ichikawai]
MDKKQEPRACWETPGQDRADRREALQLPLCIMKRLCEHGAKSSRLSTSTRRGLSWLFCKPLLLTPRSEPAGRIIITVKSSIHTETLLRLPEELLQESVVSSSQEVLMRDNVKL